MKMSISLELDENLISELSQITIEFSWDPQFLIEQRSLRIIIDFFSKENIQKPDLIKLSPNKMHEDKTLAPRRKITSYSFSTPFSFCYFHFFIRK